MQILRTCNLLWIHLWVLASYRIKLKFPRVGIFIEMAINANVYFKYLFLSNIP